MTETNCMKNSKLMITPPWKTISTWIWLGFFAAVPAFAQRESVELADGWKFTKKDAGSGASTEDWEKVSIPHCWNIADAQDGPAPDSSPKLGQRRGNYYRGACWYERSLDIPEGWKNKRVFLQFEAAATVAKPWINGEPLGEHRGAFTGFCFDVTPHLKFGQANDLRVQVDNSPFKDIAPLIGDFNVHGGIYRAVRLIATDPLFISPLDHASPGVYLSLKTVTPESASLEVKTLVANSLAAEAEVHLRIEIRDAAGNPVATSENDGRIAPGITLPVTRTVSIPHPHRWQGLKDPYLYSVVVKLLRGGKTVDEVTQPLGIRTVAISNERGFLLNGEPYPVYGVNRHQERQNEGWALSAADDEQDLKLIREMGATAIRLAHYPQSIRFHELCDRMGMLLWEETPLVNVVPRQNDPTSPGAVISTPEFDANLEQQMREMISQRINHPSVMAWGILNELSRSDSQAALPLVKRLNALAHELDAQRPTVSASNKTGLPTNKVVDWMAYNVYPGWYREFGEDMNRLLNERYAEQGNRRIGISEYGAGGNPAHHEEGAVKQPVNDGNWHTEEWQSLVHERDWAAMQANPKLWGTFLWCMFDFASDWRIEGGQPGINDKGMVTHDRQLKKDSFFFYKANWNPEPMVYITSRRLVDRQQPVTEIKIYSNADAVELKVNGKSFGAVKPDAIKACRWPEVTLSTGENRIEATAKFSAHPDITDTCRWNLLPTQ